MINIVTRSGSNAVHGSLFAFFRHQTMDATDPFAVNLEGATLRRVKPDADRQQFGATIGGPLVKDRTFYFLSYEQLRRREARTVPLLTDLSIFGATPEQLRGALSTPAPVQEMFRRNSGIFPYAPDDRKGLFRLDHRFSNADSLTFRYNGTGIYDTNEGVGALVGASRGFVQDFLDHTALLGWTHTGSAQTVNEFRGQYNYYGLRTESTDPFGPALEIAGFGLFNRDRFLPSNTLARRTEWSDNLTLIRGSHTGKLGASALIRNVTQDSKTFFSGRFTFGSLPGGLVNPALAATSITALQAFNLGLAQSY